MLIPTNNTSFQLPCFFSVPDHPILLTMTTIVYQGLQSCHESPLAESRTLRLRFSQKPRFSQSFELALKPKPCFLDSNIKELVGPREEITTQKPNVHVDKHTSPNSDSAGLTFLQIMSNHSQCPKETTQKESNVYVHPSVNRHSTLSEKSLQLCTENLGSETGTDTTILSLSSSDYVPPTREKHSSRQLLVAKKKTRSPSSFPPPLTTMGRGSQIQVRPHREDGRLIIEAVKIPPSHTRLHVERSNGRLLLSLVKDSCDDVDGPIFAQENEDSTENDMNYGKAHEEEEDEEEENSLPSPQISSQSGREEENHKEVKNDECCGEEEGNEVGLNDNRKPNCGCEEGDVKNRGFMINWERLRVASSS